MGASCGLWLFVEKVKFEPGMTQVASTISAPDLEAIRLHPIVVSALNSGSDLPGGGSTLPMIFLTPRVSVDLSSWGGRF